MMANGDQFTQEELDQLEAADRGRSTRFSGDERNRVLVTLVYNGVITMQEAVRIEDITDPSDSAEVVLGTVVGALQKPAREVADGLRGSGIDISAADLQEIKLSPSEFTEDVVSGLSKWAQGVMKIKGVLDDVGTGMIDYATRGEDQRDSPEVLAAKRDAEDEVVTAIDSMLASKAITSEKARELKRIATGYRTDRIQEVFNTLFDVASGEEKGELMDLLGDSEALDAYKKWNDTQYISPEDDPRIPEVTDPLSSRWAEPVFGIPTPGPAGPGPTGGSYGTNPFMVDAAAALPGLSMLGASGEPIPTRDRLRFIEENFVVDPSSGQAYSEEEWAEIKTNPRAHADYLAAKVTPPAIQEILNAPYFASQLEPQFRTVNYQEEDGTWKTKEVPIGSQTMGNLPPRGMQIPIEDIGIRTPNYVGGETYFPLQPWEQPSLDYKAGDGYASWMGMSSRERNTNLKLMRDQGLFTDFEWEQMGNASNPNMGMPGYPVGGGTFNLKAMGLWETALSGSQFQWSPQQTLLNMGEANRQPPPRRYGGSGASAPKYSVPSSLRSIPDYKALAQESKGIFREQLGRDLEDWELVILSDQLKEDYEEANKEKIALHRAAWEDAVAGGTTEVDFGDVRVPAASLEYDIEERYANELDRQERVEDQAVTRRILMDSITQGQRMI